jgi:Kef-type K+ transport system membrane component KefB
MDGTGAVQPFVSGQQYTDNRQFTTNTYYCMLFFRVALCPAAPPIESSGNVALENVFGEWVAAWAGFLFITIAASQCALLVRLVQLPLITGYMFFGVLVGPQVLDMVTQTDLSHLQPITQFALAFISMSAGAELYLPELRALFRRIVTITMSVTVVCFIVCMLIIFGLAKGGLIPFMSSLSGSCQFSIALIAASIMVTQSPASAIAVVAETKSKGPFTSTMLGITVLTDIVVLLLYSICAAIANANCSPVADGFHVIDLFVTVGCVLAAGGVGYVFGKLIIFLLWVPHLHGEWAVLPLGYAVFKVSSWFTDFSTMQWGHGVNFDPLLICICAGYIVANHSRNRRKFLRFMGSCGPIIFIPFFTLTGAGLNLKVMGQSAPFAFIVFTVRAATFAAGSGIGGYYTGMDKLHLQTLWISMLTQAGVSLGISYRISFMGASVPKHDGRLFMHSLQPLSAFSSTLLRFTEGGGQAERLPVDSALRRTC